MQIQFLLGPAGCGKTFRCVTEARRALENSPDGPLLVFLAPKQATFQLERHLLADSNLPGYTRLKVFSFERLAEFIFEHFEKPLPRLLTEEGRVMVLRALLGKRQEELRLFRSTARMPGFARQLSLLLRELQQHQISIQRLEELAEKIGSTNRLDHKLQDVALMLKSYREWLSENGLEDADALLDLATDTLVSELAGERILQFEKLLTSPSDTEPPQFNRRLRIETLWMDGFGQLTPQERRLLAAFMPFCDKAQLAFCMDPQAISQTSWFSPWTVVGQTFQALQTEFSDLPGCTVTVEKMERNPAKCRFPDQPVLQHLEQHWGDPKPFAPLKVVSEDGETPKLFGTVQAPIRVVSCANPEAEATMAAREILRYVRSGGRFRDTAVLVRHLDQYHDPLRRVFLRYEIPFFLDRREPVAHHPLAELTRGALRTLAYHWRQADWFSALKSGLVHDSEHEIDWLENEALARGWEGSAWEHPLRYEGSEMLPDQLETFRRKLMQPFLALKADLNPMPSGGELGHAIRNLWDSLKVRETLNRWTAAHAEKSDGAQVVHATVWEQMNDWLDNVELAFAKEALPLSQWLPILEAGLAGLSIGVVPPVLDQVLIGSVDRSRNPDLQRVFVLGINETVFPALATAQTLLTEADRLLMERHGQSLGLSTRSQLGLERFFGYIACTRARRRVVLTYAIRDGEGKALNPSCFISHLERMFPELAKHEKFIPSKNWTECEHPAELMSTLLQVQGARARAKATGGSGISEAALNQMLLLAKLPAFDPVLRRLKHLHTTPVEEKLKTGLAEQLYGPELRTSVSRLEQFAACPFRFFISSGLQAEERTKFELDIRQQGSFQHDVLAQFHESLRAEKKKWRDLSPAQAREHIAKIASELMPRFENGLLLSSEQNRFLGRTYQESLQNFIETIVGWMSQYQFDPEVVEIGFGFEQDGLQPWRLDLGHGHQLQFCGRIDRVDLLRVPGSDEALCVVVDYKSSLRELKMLYLESGLQQQLPAYLNVLRHAKNVKEVFGVSRIIPTGVFYINLAGSYGSGANRNEVLSNMKEAGRQAYAHEGLFDFDELRKLDNRPDNRTGDQFSYRLKSNGELYANSSDALPKTDFEALLDRAEDLLKDIGKRIYKGDAQIDPYKHKTDLACDKCDYKGVCRIDPWTHSYRQLKKTEQEEAE
ncbi:MAG: ATP-dependent deoxyribonuclease subunit [Verrucomicrobiales bacterium]|nr:ATP-dependent deoxyribonuclease subunit [Verrucomicrobiales bacterium]